MQKKITILGATGSIGTQTLDILSQHPDKYQLVAFSANTQVEKSFEIIKQFKPQLVVMVDEKSAQTLQDKVAAIGVNTEVLAGKSSLETIASLPEVDTVMAAIVGAAGLPPVLSAAKHGKDILLANKEALVMTGTLLMDIAKQGRATILPVDSEHNALFQCMPAEYKTGSRPEFVKKILLTASGGPFLDTDMSTFESITPAQAVKHPNWSMGAKISIDSATMMNKALEVIEAHFLFDMPVDDIDVVIHPQSIIHSMVYYEDGSYLAQLGSPDMRIPISACLSWPERITNNAAGLDFAQLGTLNFVVPDYNRFPCLKLGFEALKAGGSSMCVLNAANEEAVTAFMQGKIKFTQIADTVQHALDKMPAQNMENVEQVLDYDNRARTFAKEFIN